ncbi:MAG: adenylate/guanylate cyclase domain-containing protein [Bacteroidota bacterium]
MLTAAAATNILFYLYAGWAIAAILMLGYILRRQTIRKLKVRNQELQEEKSQSEYLLSSILPSEVIRQLKNDKIARAKAYDNVCILFTDFQGFSQIAEQLPPEVLVEELSDCFAHFDQIIEKYRLQKIKTIGDAYMCIGGLYTKGTKHVQRMTAAALEIQTFLAHRAQQTESNHPIFRARIGMHIGSVVAGVIGRNRMAFDVWGNAVNIAQQMEQQAEVGTVNVSKTTYEVIKEQFDCTFREDIQLKNGKTTAMYRVNGFK